MIDVAWTQLLFISALTFLLLGPKEVPVVLRFVGRWVGKARAMLHTFQDMVEPYVGDIDIENKAEFDVFHPISHHTTRRPPRSMAPPLPQTPFVKIFTPHPFCIKENR